MPVTGFDHIALPTHHSTAMMAFYQALGFRVPDEPLWHDVESPALTIHFGQQKINLHKPSKWHDKAFTLRGHTALPGCGDMCFVWEGGLDALYAALNQAGAEVELGPVERYGARGRGLSIYTRDPDDNLLEFILYPESP